MLAVPVVMCHNAGHFRPRAPDRAGRQAMYDRPSMRRPPTMRRYLRVLILVVLAVLGPGGLSSARAQAPAGQMTLVFNISIVPRWFDPAESEGLVTPFIFYYAIHDALVKPMPGNASTPCLAESWTTSPDGLTYEFVLRKNARFHNSETVTADDVKFSFERYRGASAKTLKDHVASVEIVDPLQIGRATCRE